MLESIRYSDGSHGGGHGDGGHGDHHIMPIPLYIGVYLALLVLTVVTVGVSYMGLGKAAIPVAMAVAVVKAGFVVGYFMHLKYDARFNQLVFFSSLGFLSLLFLFTTMDLTTRDGSVREMGNFVLVEELDFADQLAEEEAAAAAAPRLGCGGGGGGRERNRRRRRPRRPRRWTLGARRATVRRFAGRPRQP